jgi:hypothetical protein
MFMFKKRWVAWACLEIGYVQMYKCDPFHHIHMQIIVQHPNKLWLICLQQIASTMDVISGIQYEVE